MEKRNKQNELVDENGLRIGDHIPGSKYLRSFCCMCGEPIRVPTKGLLNSICSKCCRPYPKVYKPITGETDRAGLFHLLDYDSNDGNGSRH